MEFSVEHIARICHETNRAFCQSIGDDSQLQWNEAAQWQRDSAIKGVAFAISTPNAPASAQHDAWLADKKKDGWIYGVEKNSVLKTHPCCVPYEQLPAEQRIKDYLFKAIVSAFVTAKKEEAQAK
jgi:hypothetical protein